MSLEVLLIPAALAAYSVWQARAEAAGAHCVVQTRLRDPELLDSALRSLGATTTTTGTEVVGDLDGTRLAFRLLPDGVVAAHVEHADRARAEELVRRVDEEYAALVQGRLYERLLARAAELGLLVEGESVGQDGAITVVLAGEVR